MTFRVVVLFMVGCVSLNAQNVRPLSSTKIYGELQKLKSMTSVLYIAAHPDDENTRLLAWLANGQHVRTSYMSITRGDGGQNILGGEQGAVLGLIRTYELLEARKLDGAEQYFGRAVDFGFSKSSQETFKQWDRIELIADVVRAIRVLKPDVVICRFPKDSNAGHGQHAASAIIAEDAVKYCRGELQLPAADLARIEASASRNNYVERYGTWKPSRLLFNALRFGNRNTVQEGMFRLDVGQYDPSIGMGYGELAGISRSLHRSQGAGTPSTPGVQPEFFGTIIGDAPVTGLFDGIETTWKRVGRQDIANDIEHVINAFNMQHPEYSVTALLNIRRKIVGLNDEHWRAQKLAAIDKIILSCIGFSSDVSVSMPMVAAGTSDSLSATVRFISRGGIPVKVLFGTNEVLCEHDSLKTIKVTVPSNSNVTQPYWLRGGVSQTTTLFSTGDIYAFEQNSNALKLNVVIAADTISVTVPVSYKKLDPLRGDVFEELRIVPPVSIEPLTQLVIGSAKPEIKVRLRAYANVQGAQLSVMDGESVLATLSEINLHEQTDTVVTVIPTIGKNTTLLIVVRANGQTYRHHVRTVNYDHLPTLQYLEPANVKIVIDPVAISTKHIAFIAGSGEYTPEFLRNIGASVEEISDESALKVSELQKFDAVLVGIRAINTNKNMKFIMPALLKYVEQGGTLVMQYNTMQTMSTKELGPYSLPLSHNRVTEENAEVKILKPEHPMLFQPNTITQKDFDGWVQERGLYFPFEFDNRYEALLSMHDEGEGPLNGSLLYTKYGKGHFMYCSLSLFRQLPAGVPGAMKLLANMLSFGR